MTTANKALEQLRAGNQRFTATLAEQRAALVKGQAPVAVVLACADSRVPVETVFDQTLGDLFVVRVAGNIATPTQIGSIEFAATRLGARLVVVLGHSHCGAVAATLDVLASESGVDSPNLGEIAAAIAPAVSPILARHGGDSESAMDEAVTANVRANVERLREGSAVLRAMLDNGSLRLVGAEYSLESGAVRFLD